MSGLVDPTQILSAASPRSSQRAGDTLLGALGSLKPGNNARIRVGVVTAIAPTAFVVTATIAGDTTTPVANIPIVAEGYPKVGDTILLLQVDGSYVCIGVQGGPTRAPFCSINRTASMTIPTATTTVYDFNQTRYESHSGLSMPVLASDAIALPFTGIYTVTATVDWSTDALVANTWRQVNITQNGSAGGRIDRVPGVSTRTTQSVPATIAGVAGDLIRVSLIHNAGSDRVVDAQLDVSFIGG